MSADRRLIAAVRRELAARADPGTAPQMQAYMKSEMPFLGVQRRDRDAAVRAALGAHPLADAATWRDTVAALFAGATHREERYAAIDLAAHRRHRAFRTLAALPLYEDLIVTGAWWDLVDPVATGLAGELLLREPAKVTPVLRRWSRDSDRWRRRAAIIAQVKAKDRTDTALLAAVIEPNRGDSDFFIRKAIGWALRAHAWTDGPWVEAYVAAHDLSPLSRREALRNR